MQGLASPYADDQACSGVGDDVGVTAKSRARPESSTPAQNRIAKGSGQPRSPTLIKMHKDWSAR